jgi:hypothetical protein
VKFVVCANPDRTEICMMTHMQWDTPDHLGRRIQHRDVDGEPMHIIFEFDADTWDEAASFHRMHLDLGTYDCPEKER